jgi:predicted nucleic acid-binding protein
MVLVDTSVWVAHLRDGNTGLETLLNEGHVAGHSFISGELACGNLKNRSEILSLLQALPMAIHAEHDEVVELIEAHNLMGKGSGLHRYALARFGPLDGGPSMDSGSET